MSETTEPRELPEELTYADWRTAIAEGRLLGQECGDCGHVEGTPKGACSQCGARALTTVDLPTAGEVYSETTIQVPPIQFEEEAYQVAIVEVGDARLLARLEGDAVGIGEEVELSGSLDSDDGNPAPTFAPA
jgi:uncharacterized OB-fold protein